MIAALSSGVASTPTLLSLDPREIVENANTKNLTKLKERKQIKQRREAEADELKKKVVTKKVPRSITFTDYDSVHDPVADTFIRNLSPFA
ncbi:hypothetical protein HBI81_243510 [Parastagonospora nodorum]|nr:hypothetical protein HBI18_247880 [Parastagonospora nodorum]KAH6511573.1 hypothetical protein HBI81_243510 [Parastagonospora nodorum]